MEPRGAVPVRSRGQPAQNDRETLANARDNCCDEAEATKERQQAPAKDPVPARECARFVGGDQPSGRRKLHWIQVLGLGPARSCAAESSIPSPQSTGSRRRVGERPRYKTREVPSRVSFHQEPTCSPRRVDPCPRHEREGGRPDSVTPEVRTRARLTSATPAEATRWPAAPTGRAPRRRGEFGREDTEPRIFSPRTAMLATTGGPMSAARAWGRTTRRRDARGTHPRALAVRDPGRGNSLASGSHGASASLTWRAWTG